MAVGAVHAAGRVRVCVALGVRAVGVQQAFWEDELPVGGGQRLLVVLEVDGLVAAAAWHLAATAHCDLRADSAMTGRGQRNDRAGTAQ